MQRYSFLKNELINLSPGIYLLEEGLIFEYPLIEKFDIVDCDFATYAYGTNDYLIIYENDRKEIRVASKHCNLALVNKEKIDIDLLLKQMRKKSDLHTVLCHKTLHPQSANDVRSSRVYAMLAWIDKYFYEQKLTLTHGQIAALCLSTRVTLSRSIKSIRQLGLIATGRERVKISKKAGQNILN